jgi:hypothetical protein
MVAGGGPRELYRSAARARKRPERGCFSGAGGSRRMAAMAHGDMDGRLREAARSAEVAAMLARTPDDPSRRYLRLSLLVAGAAVAIGLVWIGVSSMTGPRRAAPPHEPAEEIDNSHYLSPIKTESAGPGEETAPFSGFAISVETDPPAGLVTIAGVPRGEAPVLANVDCKPGARLEIRAEKVGFPPARRETTCRADALLKLTIRLGK